MVSVRKKCGGQRMPSSGKNQSRCHEYYTHILILRKAGGSSMATPLTGPHFQKEQGQGQGQGQSNFTERNCSASPAEEDSVCFDSDGCFINNKHKTNVAERFVRDNVFGVLLNLDPAPWMHLALGPCYMPNHAEAFCHLDSQASPNANTISLFKDDRRASRSKKSAAFPFVTCSLERADGCRHIIFIHLQCLRLPATGP